jgi:hypothetical protein
LQACHGRSREGPLWSVATFRTDTRNLQPFRLPGGRVVDKNVDIFKDEEQLCVYFSKFEILVESELWMPYFKASCYVM